MKKIKIVLLITTLCFFTNSHAQFFKKLKKRAEEAIKETVTRKVEEKTEKETEKTFDTIFNSNRKIFKGKKTKIEENYLFTHKYSMKIISKKDTTYITYYLTNKNEYMGSSFITDKNQHFITVMDLPNTAIHTFMNLEGQKKMSSIKIDLVDINQGQKNTSNLYIAATGQTKKIIGYLCEEFQITGTKLSGQVWVTQEADISFQKAMNQLKTKKAKGIDQSWVSMVDGLVLEMKMIDYSRRKPKPIKMICTDLSKNDFSIETSEYQK